MVTDTRDIDTLVGYAAGEEWLVLLDEDGVQRRLPRYRDGDGDAWLDGIPRTLARWHGGKRGLEEITTIVVHRYSRGRGEAGPRYVQHPGGRHVSWHATAHHGGFARPSTLHLPIDIIGWHAGDRRINRVSIGVEGDAAVSGNVHDPWDDDQYHALVDMVVSWRELCPNLRYCTGHHDIVPKRRQDPGHAFPWEDFEADSGLVRLRAGEIGKAWLG